MASCSRLSRSEAVFAAREIFYLPLAINRTLNRDLSRNPRDSDLDQESFRGYKIGRDLKKFAALIIY